MERDHTTEHPTEIPLLDAAPVPPQIEPPQEPRGFFKRFVSKFGATEPRPVTHETHMATSSPAEQATLMTPNATESLDMRSHSPEGYVPSQEVFLIDSIPSKRLSRRTYTDLGDTSMSRRTLLKGALGLAGAEVLRRTGALESTALAQGNTTINGESSVDRKETHAETNNLPAAETVPSLESQYSAEQIQKAKDAMQRSWERTDKVVADGQVHRTWMWGPQPNSDVILEEYAEAPGGYRMVRYFDKSRQEVNNPDGDDTSPWFVTNGLLVMEMAEGYEQIGDSKKRFREPAQVNIVGDLNDPDGVTFASLHGREGDPEESLLKPVEQLVAGTPVRAHLDRAGAVTYPEDTPSGASVAHYEAGHNIATTFWDFMNGEGTIVVNGEQVEGKLFDNPYYATGLPVTEPYWVDAMVSGVKKKVLMQCFERRVLTDNPNNPDGWQVEAGNIGLQYHEWRYNVETDPSCDINPNFPQEVITEDGIMDMINESCDAGYKKGSDPVLTFEAMKETYENLYPGEKLVLTFKAKSSDVTDDPNAIYSQTAAYSRIKEGVQDGKFYYHYDEATKTNYIEMSVPEGDLSNISGEEEYNFNYMPISNVFLFSQNKGDIFKPYSDDTTEAIRKFGLPKGENDKQPLEFVYSPLN
jgi:hypothetical protein